MKKKIRIAKTKVRVSLANGHTVHAETPVQYEAIEEYQDVLLIKAFGWTEYDLLTTSTTFKRKCMQILTIMGGVK